MSNLPAGKLPPDLLASLLAGLPPLPGDVIVGAQVGEDAAVLDGGDRFLVLAADPVTLSAEPGAFAVAINANDIAVMGADPRWLLATVLLPPGTSSDAATHIMHSLIDACREIKVALIGGHTEVTPGVVGPIVAATMIGEVAPDRLVRSSGARPGDALLLAGPIAIEGTAILAREYAEDLAEAGVTAEVIIQGARLLDEPGISVLPAARALTSVLYPHAMHDPTEGGLLAAVSEVALASHCGARIDLNRVPVLPACRAICDALELNPLALLASGSLLAALDPADIDSALAALHTVGIDAAVIGEVLPPEEGFLLRDGIDQPFPAIERDELARWIENRR